MGRDIRHDSSDPVVSGRSTFVMASADGSDGQYYITSSSTVHFTLSSGISDADISYDESSTECA